MAGRSIEGDDEVDQGRKKEAARVDRERDRQLQKNQKDKEEFIEELLAGNDERA